MKSGWRNHIQQKWVKLLHFLFRLKRGLTIGVRAVVITDKQTVLLVKHSYTPGWHFPGGGVEPGETAEETLARELLEETGLQIGNKPSLHGIFFNGHVSNHDHILVYRCSVKEEITNKPTSLEIAEIAFFDLSQLPDDIDEGTEKRLFEITQGQKNSLNW